MEVLTNFVPSQLFGRELNVYTRMVAVVTVPYHKKQRINQIMHLPNNALIKQYINQIKH